MKLWVVSMECAGIAEAGGVKNVTYSICKEFAELKHSVTLFMPVFKCTSFKDLEEKIPEVKEAADSAEEKELSAQVTLCGKKEEVTYKQYLSKNGAFDVVLINHPLFAEKEAIYTYTAAEEELDSTHTKGTGHKDALFLDTLFQKAVCAYGSLIPRSDIPDVLHCQDASTAVLPAYIAESKAFKKTTSLVTIHNAGPFYHHEFTSIGESAWYTGLATELLEDSLNGTSVEPFLIAANSGAHLTTVSEHYAEELVEPANMQLTDGLSYIFAKKNIPIKGITNGFDYERYNPTDKNCSKLPFEYDPEKGDFEGKLKCRKFFVQNIVNTNNYDTDGIKKYGRLDCSTEYTKEIFIAYHGRVTSQKGISVLTESIPYILGNFPDVRFILAGQGETFLENDIIELTKKYPGKITFMNGYNQSVVRLVTAVSDFVVLPSFFEPCGLEDFIAQAFGTVPVAHKTGGLNKITEKTGFLYDSNTAGSLTAKLSEVIMLKELRPSVMTKIIKAGASSVHHEYLWKNVIQKKYIPFLKEILKKSRI
ncbi:MAG: glycogen/starch synthase [Treponema sp.]|nr:glycogen/starch synthase [Treponema sp.]